MEFWKNYKSTLLLVGGLVVGGICGAVFGEGATVVRPVGELFLNLLFVLIVPLVFFSMSSAIARMKAGGQAGRVIGISLAVFLGMALISALAGYGWFKLWDPLRGVDKAALLSHLPPVEPAPEQSFGELLVSTLTVPDFLLLFDKSHLLPLILFALLLGAAVPPKGPVARALDAGLDVVIRMMNLIMVAAPVGLGCYFADTVGRTGGTLIGGYLNIFLCYTALALVVFFLGNTLYMLLAGKGKIKAFWRHIAPPALTAVATTSSAAAMPLGITAARDMGVREEIAGTVLPLGVNIHKNGTVIGAVFKILFLAGLFGAAMPGNLFAVLGVAILTGMVMGAVPTGGMTGELLICSIFGFPPEMAAIIMIISTLIDIPATMLNACENVTAAVLVDRFA